MLEAVMPKIIDIQTLKGVSALLALPMLCVAYFLQTGPQICLGESHCFGLNANLTVVQELGRLILIFVLKSIAASFVGFVAYVLVAAAHLHIRFPLVQLTSIVMIAFSILGIFSSGKFPQLKLIDPFWFYGLLVWGLFLQSMKDQLDRAQEANRPSKNDAQAA
jgi:hypothetical protein